MEDYIVRPIGVVRSVLKNPADAPKQGALTEQEAEVVVDPAYLLSGNSAVTRFLGLKASRKFPVMNGPIDCRLLKYELY